jgi:hypothetical protein
MEVQNEQRVNNLVFEFDITDNEVRQEDVQFDSDVVDFCWVPKPDIERLTCHVRLFDAETLQELTNGKAEVVIEANSSERKWMSFSGFGWWDEGQSMPVDRCRFEASIDGTDSITLEVYV